MDALQKNIAATKGEALAAMSKPFDSMAFIEGARLHQKGL